MSYSCLHINFVIINGASAKDINGIINEINEEIAASAEEHTSQLGAIVEPTAQLKQLASDSEEIVKRFTV